MIGALLLATLTAATHPSFVVSLQRSDGELFAAAPNGTAERRITRRLESEGDPDVSRDGRRVVFVAWPGPDDPNTQLDVLDLDSGQIRRLPLPKGNKLMPTWSPDGQHVAWRQYNGGHDTHLWIAAADGSGARAVTRGRGARSWRAWSPDGKQIAYVRDFDVYAVDITTRRERRLADVSEPMKALRWSPDGRWIAAERSTAGTPKVAMWIVVVDVRTGRASRIERAPQFAKFHYRMPGWLPDGRLVVWINFDLYAMNVDGTSRSRLTGTGRVGIDWSLGGATLVYPRDVGREPQLFALDASRLRRIAERRAIEPAVSPDGRTIAFMDDTTVAPRRGYYVMPIAGGSARKVAPADDHPITEPPSWSPDGRRLVVLTRRGLEIVDVASLKRHFLRGLRPNDFDSAWSPDGRTIAFTRYRGDVAGVWTLPARGGTAKLLRRAAAEPSWSPDAARIAFRDDPSRGNVDVWTMRRDGKGLLRVRRSPTTDERDPKWSPDGSSTAFLSWDDQGTHRFWISPARGSRLRPLAFVSYSGYDWARAN